MIADHIDRERRSFLGAAAMTVATAQLSSTALALAGETKLPSIKPGTNTSFASLKRIDAGLLNVEYAEAGPMDGPPVILLHGWPYDIHTYVDVAPLLASAGYRVIVPSLRGYGATRFLSSETTRNGHVSIVIHNYRWRLALATGEPHPDPSAYAKKFSGKYYHRTLSGGIGHNLPQEAPQAFAEAIVAVDRYRQ